MKTIFALVAATLLVPIAAASGQEMLTPELRSTPTATPTPTPTPSPTSTPRQDATPEPEATPPRPEPTAAETPAPSETSSPAAREDVQEQRAAPAERPAATPRTQTFEKIRAVDPPAAGARSTAPAEPVAAPPATPRPRQTEESTAPAARETAVRGDSDNRVNFSATGLLNAGRTVAILRRLEKVWEEEAHDEQVVDRLVADDFVGVGPDGKVISKRSMLQRARRIAPGESASAGTRSMDVKLFGPDVAVITGVARETGVDRQGKNFNLNYRFTDTWMLRNNRWQCIASHAMLLPR